MIQYFDRNSKQYKIEKVAGEKYLNWIHTSYMGKTLLELLIKKKLFSYLYGKYCDTKFSAKKISSFIKDFNIDMSISYKCISDFLSFNDFFTRTLKPNVRDIHADKKDLLISPCDGKLLAYENIDKDNIVQVKGLTYSLKEFINDSNLSNKFQNGSCLIFRLCPTDYHRFHFIDNGTCSKVNKIKGNYYSVNPIALKNIKKVFCENKREWSVFNSENFGDVLYIDVGATCVGSIIQTYVPNKFVSKGDEKGYFKFGGSTVVLFFEKDTIKIDKDILEQTKLGFETSVIMGEKIGLKYHN